MNLFFVLHYCAVNIYAVLILWLILRNPRSPVHIALAMLVASFGVWGLGHTFIYAADTAAEAIRGDNIAFFGVATFAPNTLLFSLLFTRRMKKLTKRYLIPLLAWMYIPCFLLIHQQFQGNISVTDIPSEFGWMPRIRDNIWILVYVIHYLSCTFSGIALLFIHSRRAVDPLERKQARLTFWAFTIPFSAAQFTDLIFPLLGQWPLPPMNPVFSVFPAASIIFAMRKYNFLRTLRRSFILIDSLRSNKAHLLVTDTQQHTVLHANKNGDTLFLPGQLRERPDINDICFFDDDRTVQIYLQKAETTGSTHTFRCNIIEKKKRIFPAEVSCSSLRDISGNTTGFIIIINDISDTYEKEKQMEQDIARAEKAGRGTGRFLSNVTQELQSPVETITTYADILCRTENDPEKSEMLRHIRTSSRHLMSIVSNMLNISLMKSGSTVVSHDTVDIQVEIDFIRRDLASMFESRDIEFITTVDEKIPPLIVIDRSKLRQIITNLLSNAMKYTPSGGRAVLSVSATENHCVIRVSDTGIGIDPDEQEKIYNTFYRGKSNVSSTSGAGLGLTITRELLTLLNGTIDLTSNPGKGSSFLVRIPFTTHHMK